MVESVISVDEKSQLKITLGNRKYRLGYTGKSRKRDYAKLLSEISSQGSKVEKISVYPQVNYKSKSKHGGEKAAYEISFNLVSVGHVLGGKLPTQKLTVEKPSVKENQKRAGIFEHLASGEFQISGYWQYVRFSSCPGITKPEKLQRSFSPNSKQSRPEKSKQVVATQSSTSRMARFIPRTV